MNSLNFILASSERSASRVKKNPTNSSNPTAELGNIFFKTKKPLEILKIVYHQFWLEPMDPLKLQYTS